MQLSIHAPTRGATNVSISLLLATDCFQSTLLQEERLLYRLKIVMNLMLSIHAPTRGATSMEYLLFLFPNFQSTLLQEERPPHTHTSRKPSPTFNPRSYKRSDVQDNSITPFRNLSIHAPTRGATFPYFK